MISMFLSSYIHIKDDHDFTILSDNQKDHAKSRVSLSILGVGWEKGTQGKSQSIVVCEIAYLVCLLGYASFSCDLPLNSEVLELKWHIPC